MMHPPTSRPQGFPADTGLYATSTAATPAQPHVDAHDSELSEILNTVIEIAPDYNGAGANGINILQMMEQQQSVSQPPVQQQQNDFNEKMAISAITQSLMQFEQTKTYNISPPAYPSINGLTSQSNQQVRFSVYYRISELGMNLLCFCCC